MTEYVTLRVGDKLDYGFDYDVSDWLGTDTLASSNWTVSPISGLTLTGETYDTTKTAVFGEVSEAGTYRLVNVVGTTGGRSTSRDIIIGVDAVVGSGYLSAAEAQARLWGRYKIEADIAPGDIEVASDELDAMAPFIDYRYSYDTALQTRQFPRGVTLAGDTENEVPERILDWVALRAYQLSSDEEPATISESIGGVSVTYAGPKPSQTERRMAGLLSPYLRRVGVRL